ncbi:hypothetical protein Bca52824_036118 [Brassica carinata]|uniref:Secreted protein n=1 Tax=Brassica carinata TaxID=52824 RepID=A0A8X7V4N9_BRACI|nr:hypothetical protein Bca52824_036118 [Brassica carinata]
MPGAATPSAGVMLLACLMWRSIGSGDVPCRLGCNCSGALAVSETEKVGILGEFFRLQNNPKTQTVVTLSICE